MRHEPTSDEIRYLSGLVTIDRRSTYFQVDRGGVRVAEKIDGQWRVKE